MVDSRQPIYLDYAASTPLDPRVLDAMLPWLSHAAPGNAQARHHAYGATAAQAVEAARAQVARRIGAAPGEIVFTSGATEANNLALKGLARHLKASGKTHIVTSAMEHASVLEPLRALEGFAVTALAPTGCGLIEAGMIAKALTDRTGLVTVQAVNNETGAIQPLSEIAAMLARRDILFHTDAAQALGKMEFDAARTGADFASLSAHKVYGPQGIGALYVKPGRKKLLEPLQHGGGQENALRSGTVPAALCAGFGMACALIGDDRQRLQDMRAALLHRLKTLQPDIHGHRQAAWNVPGILNIGFPGIDNETLVMALPGLAFGTGAACTGRRHSHVIEALTGSAQKARESIRLSFGRFTTMEDLNKAASQIIAAVTGIKELKEAA